jgi:hypothetical protein
MARRGDLPGQRHKNFDVEENEQRDEEPAKSYLK